MGTRGFTLTLLYYGEPPEILEVQRFLSCFIRERQVSCLSWMDRNAQYSLMAMSQSLQLRDAAQSVTHCASLRTASMQVLQRNQVCGWLLLSWEVVPVWSLLRKRLPR